jgi:hypothetical protein
MINNYWISPTDREKGEPFTLLGIEGHLIKVPSADGIWDRQEFYARREFKPGGCFDILLRYDRGPKQNTSNSFSIVRDFGNVSGPLSIEEAVQYWPELAHLVKWHLSSEGEPLYYIENTLYWVEQGKLELARKCCHWLDATDEQLTHPLLREALAARLPALQQQFRDELAATGLLLHP